MNQTGFEFAEGQWREVRPRIGERQTVGTSVRWASGSAPPEVRKRRRSRVDQGDAMAVDLSVSGARLSLPAGADFHRNSTFQLEVDGAWSTAVVAWIEPPSSCAVRLCGVIFVVPSPEFMAAVSRVLVGLPGPLAAPSDW